MSTTVGFGSPEYVEQLTPAERRLYLNYFAEEAKERENARRGNVFDARSPAIPPGINMAGLNIQQDGNNTTGERGT